MVWSFKIRLDFITCVCCRMGESLHSGEDIARNTHRLRAPFLCQITQCHVVLLSRLVSRGEILASGLHDLFCQSRQCYIPAEGCVCKLCNSHADHKSHIIHCRLATKGEPFDLNFSNINMIVKML